MILDHAEMAASRHGRLLATSQEWRTLWRALRPADRLAVRGALLSAGEHPKLDYLRIVINARMAKLDERGASAVEYGLLIADIAALIVVIVFAFGGVLKNIFVTTCNSVGSSSGQTCRLSDRSKRLARLWRPDGALRRDLGSPVELETPAGIAMPPQLRLTDFGDARQGTRVLRLGGREGIFDLTLALPSPSPELLGRARVTGGSLECGSSLHSTRRPPDPETPGGRCRAADPQAITKMSGNLQGWLRGWPGRPADMAFSRSSTRQLATFCGSPFVLA
jgi:pilus assembly protein Flp/PilA